MRGWGRRVPPPPHAAGEMGQALKAVSRLGEPDGGGAASHPHQLKVCCYLGALCPALGKAALCTTLGRAFQKPKLKCFPSLQGRECEGCGEYKARFAT